MVPNDHFSEKMFIIIKINGCHITQKDISGARNVTNNQVCVKKYKIKFVKHLRS